MMYAIIIMSTPNFKFCGPIVECYTHATGSMNMQELSELLTRHGWPAHDIRQYSTGDRIELEITDDDYLGDSTGKMKYLVKFQPVLEHVEVLG